MLDDELIDRLKAASATCMAHGLLESSIVIDLAIGEIRALRSRVDLGPDAPLPIGIQDDEEHQTYEVS